MGNKGSLTEVEVDDLQGIALVISGLRIVAVVIAVLGVPNDYYHEQYDNGTLVDESLNDLLSVVSSAYRNWFTTQISVPIIFAAQILIALAFLTRWRQSRVSIAQSWWWPLAEIVMTLLLLNADQWMGISGMPTVCTLLLLACGGGKRGILAAAVIMVGSLIAINLGDETNSRNHQAQLVAVLISSGTVLAGTAMRYLVFSRGRAFRRRTAALAEETATRERIRRANWIHDGLSKTLDGNRLLAIALARQLEGQADGLSRLAEQVVDALSMATNSSRALLLKLRGEDGVDLAAVCRLAAAQFSQSEPETRVLLDVPDSPLEVKSPIYQLLAQAVSELLENARVRGRVGTVRICLTGSNEMVELTVSTEDPAPGRMLDMAWLGRIGQFNIERMKRMLSAIGASVDSRWGPHGMTAKILCPLQAGER